jgi:hypothetical protein
MLWFESVRRCCCSCNLRPLSLRFRPAPLLGSSCHSFIFLYSLYLLRLSCLSTLLACSMCDRGIDDFPNSYTLRAFITQSSPGVHLPFAFQTSDKSSCSSAIEPLNTTVSTTFEQASIHTR